MLLMKINEILRHLYKINKLSGFSYFYNYYNFLEKLIVIDTQSKSIQKIRERSVLVENIRETFITIRSKIVGKIIVIHLIVPTTINRKRCPAKKLEVCEEAKNKCMVETQWKQQKLPKRTKNSTRGRGYRAT